MEFSHVFLAHFMLGLMALFDSVQPDPDPIFDYCVADNNNFHNIFLNGPPCINPDHTLVSHFASSALSKPGDVTQSNFNVTYTDVANFPGLNSLGLVMARTDIAANGLVPPHSHPRASELLILLNGSLLVGFLDTSNRLYRQQLRPGDCFMFPKGLIHFMFNLDSENSALAISGLNSQSPGAQMSSGAVNGLANAGEVRLLGL